MKPLASVILVVCFMSLTCHAQELDTRRVFENVRLHRPLYLAPVPGDRDRLVVLEQDGVVSTIEYRKTPALSNASLDIRNKVLRNGNEEGLLGLAFHPDFTKNHFVYLVYSADNPRRNILSRWNYNTDTHTLDPQSERVILEVNQPWSNHNGGMIDFGPDGYLYYSLGDGGAGGDPRNSAQNLHNLLGKILRIDVNREENNNRYAIPNDNPFVNEPGACPEIYAYGLRNVWRFSFDPDTGDLWAGDVGQNAWEEVDLIEKGKNYGWRIREGKHDFNRPGSGVPDDLVEPIIDYPRGEGISVTGGYVYRGKQIPWLTGAYIYGDYGSNKIWLLRYDKTHRAVTENRFVAVVRGVSSFGLDHDNELYAVSLDGPIYKFVGKE
ncbi:MAG: glucose sorbosone dehydrogenase [Phycisphaera sp.]|nr:glucose sorbosone dehydrogenase [Phycisphaera sp.]